MPHVDFSIIHEEGAVTIVRSKATGQKKATVSGQSMKVQCFDSDQIDRIFHYQELLTKRNESKKESFIKKILHL